MKLAHLGPTNIGFYRMLSGGLMLLAILVASRLRNSARPSTVRRFNLSTLLLSALAGLIFALDLSFWHRSVLSVGVGLSTMLVSLQVFFVAAFGLIFLKERLTPRLAIATLLALAGMALVVRFDPDRAAPRYGAGVLFGLIPAVCYAAYILILRRVEARAGPQATVANLAVVSFAGALLLGTEGAALGESFLVPDAVSLFAVLGLGLVGQVLGWITITRELPKVRASTAALILLLQPALSFVWDMLFFSRHFSLPGLAGVAITMSAIYLGAAGRAGSPS